MKKNCVANIKIISEDEVIGDSLKTINDNFNILADIACGVYGVAQQLNQTGTGSITRITGKNGVVTEPETGIVTVSQSYSPPWHVGATNSSLYAEEKENKFSQQVTKSALLLDYFNQLMTLTPVLCGTESYTFINTNNINPVMQYLGVLTIGDGRLLLFPGALGTGSIYNPYNGLFTKINVPIPIGFANAILLPDGKVCLIPGTPKNIYIWSPQTNTLFISKIDLSIPGVSNPYNGGTLLPDGRILLTPFGRQDGTIIYDPSTDTIKEIKSSVFTTTGNKSFFSGTLSLDGKYVYLTPHDATQMVRISVNEPHVVEFVGSGVLNNSQLGAFSSAVLLPNGKIFLTPYNSSSAMVYDPDTDTFTPVGVNSFVAGAWNYITSILLPDGRVCMVPYGAGKFAFYNFKDDTVLFSPPVGSALQKYIGATVLENGDIFVAPCVEDKAVIINTGNQQGFMRATVTGVFFKETL